MDDCEYVFNNEEIVSLCFEWQRELRLQHWEIAVKIARECEFETKNAQGECRWTLSTAQATIKIIDSVDYPSSPFKQDMEKTLVHELLHLHFASFDETKNGSLEEVMLERCIDHISKALVNLKRKAAFNVKTQTVIGL